ncbi:BID domain-containing T4SS effector [Bartonella phoceensis]|uniref:BID domain-containing T4SS effector n=1 Tax=Bartonella phoceensis TaxID=270249 RepID=UPI001ABA4118|nr:BID domain-containing T4SS effector [Bartonella phoceensis]
MTKELKGHPGSLTQEEEKTRKHPSINEQEVRARLQRESENYFIPGTTIFKNKYHIKDEKGFSEACFRDAKKAMDKIRVAAPPEQLNSAYLKELHKQMFSKAFEWAGHTRDESFPLQDGSVVSMAFLKKKEYKKAFASGIDIQKGLQKLDEMLLTKEELQSLTREEFVTHATQVMAHLHSLNAFREGNRRTTQIFMEKLGQAAGHELDFSLVTKKRKDVVRAAIMNDDNNEPLRHLLDDISNPEKLLVLNEFTNSMRELGLDENNYRLAVAAQEGQTYQGIYRGAGPDGFMMDVNGTFVVAPKKHLPPEQVKTLKIGDPLSFTAPSAQEAEKVLLPKENVPDLSNEELAQRVYGHPVIGSRLRRIHILSQVVYGKQHALQHVLPKLEIPVNNDALARAERFARDVQDRPQRHHRVRGFSIFGLKSGARQHAAANFLPLSHAILDYLYAVKDIEKEIRESHAAEQQRCAESVETPSDMMQNLFFLPEQQQKEILSSSHNLRQEVEKYYKHLNDRLSSSDWKLINERYYSKLAEDLGTSVTQAGQIAAVARQTKELNDIVQQQRDLSVQQVHGLHQSPTKSGSEKVAAVSTAQMSEAATVVNTTPIIQTASVINTAKTSQTATIINTGQMSEKAVSTSATQTGKVVELDKQGKAPEEKVPQYKPGYVRWESGSEKSVETSAKKAEQEKIVRPVEQSKALEEKARQRHGRSMSL